MEEALAQIDRLETTISDLLELARDAHTGEPFTLTSLLEQIAADWVPVLRSDGRILRVVSPPMSLEVVASKTAIRQILDVLLDNAVRHGSGTVTLTAGGFLSDSSAVLEVQDEGQGTEGDPARIFVRRAPDATGHGIGLALARSLAEAEGGRLEVRQTRPTTFIVIIPARHVPQLNDPGGGRGQTHRIDNGADSTHSGAAAVVEVPSPPQRKDLTGQHAR